MADHLHLPERVALPASMVLMDHARLRIVLGNVDRRRISYWRKAHGFPSPIREGRTTYVFVSDVAEWLRCRGVRTEII